jgi:hypothetical protein
MISSYPLVLPMIRLTLRTGLRCQAGRANGFDAAGPEPILQRYTLFKLSLVAQNCDSNCPGAPQMMSVVSKAPMPHPIRLMPNIVSSRVGERLQDCRHMIVEKAN